MRFQFLNTLKVLGLLGPLLLMGRMYGMTNDLDFASKTSAFVVRDGSTLRFETGSPIIDDGTLVNTGFGNITGSNIRFRRGVYSFFNSVSNLNGVLNPNNDIINLGNNPEVGGDTMIANPGGLSQVSINVFSGANLLRGQPLFFGANDIIFRDPSAILGIAVQNTLSTNITLNGGILLLQDDLRLGDGAVILDNGIVAFDRRRLSIGGAESTWNGTIVWFNSNDIQLNSRINLNGNWIFLGDGQINGNGNVIELAPGSSITVVAGSTLRLAGVQINNLGAGAGTISLASSANLVLSDVTIEMVSDYNIDSGTVRVEGSSTIITKDKILTFQNAGKLIVEGASLTYDTQGTIDQRNIRPLLIDDPNRINVDVLGAGDIRTFREDPITSQNYRTKAALLRYSIIAPWRAMNIAPEVLEDMSLNFDVVIDGNTNFLGFTNTLEQCFIISSSVHAMTTNIVMRDFSPQNVKFNQDSSLVFGDKTLITLARNEVLDYQWTFSGNVILKGGGQILTLGPNGSLVVQGTHGSLTLDGVTLKGVQGTNVRMEDSSSILRLKDVRLTQSGDFIYEQGGIEISNLVTLSSPFNFTYASNEPLRILPNSTLTMMWDQIFTYAPTSGDPNLFQFADSTSAFMIDQITIQAVTPLTLDVGRFVVRNTNFVSGDLIFGPTLILDQPSGATLEQF